MKKRELIKKLSIIYKNDDLMIDTLKENLQCMEDYVNAVSTMEMQIPFIRVQYTGQDMIERVMHLDKKRRICHEAAIAAIKMTDRIARINGMTFYSGEDDRWKYAEFCEEIHHEFFETRDKHQKETLR
jgi:hypothetical protein